MGFKRTIAAIGLAGLLAISGCNDKTTKRRDNIDSAYKNTCLLNSGSAAPLKLNFNGEEIKVDFSYCTLHYQRGETEIWYGDDFTKVNRKGLTISDPEVISAAEKYSEKLLTSVLEEQKRMIDNGVSGAKSDLEGKIEKAEPAKNSVK